MLVLGLIPLGLLALSYRRWQAAEGPRRRAWASFVACNLAGVLLLLAWLVLPPGPAGR